MSNGELILYLILLLVGLGLSALYSGMEIGFYTINRVRVAVLEGRGDRRARRLRACMLKPNRTLATLLVGNNIANYAGSFGLAAILNSMDYGPLASIAINAGILIPLLFIFGETLPKDLFRTHTDRWSYATSGFLVASRRFLTLTGLVPLVEGFGSLIAMVLGARGEDVTSARQHISRLIKEGVDAGVISVKQTNLADRALALRDRTVSMEMIPWSRVFYISADSEQKIREHTIRRRNFTRLPVVAKGGKVIGVMSILEALLDPKQTTKDLCREAIEFTPDVRVHQALSTMRHARQTMAIVIDPRTKRPLGLVTLKDLVEPLIGDLTAW